MKTEKQMALKLKETMTEFYDKLHKGDINGRLKGLYETTINAYAYVLDLQPIALMGKDFRNNTAAWSALEFRINRMIGEVENE